VTISHPGLARELWNRLVLTATWFVAPFDEAHGATTGILFAAFLENPHAMKLGRFRFCVR
jgi:hypothetical protein